MDEFWRYLLKMEGKEFILRETDSLMWHTVLLLYTAIMQHAVLLLYMASMGQAVLYCT